MTPQQLIDLPGYGQANKRVKAMGHWRETINDTERIEWLDRHEVTVRNNMTAKYVIDRIEGENWSDGLRGMIDVAARNRTLQNYEGHK